jgi:hypothetical protein
MRHRPPCMSQPRTEYRTRPMLTHTARRTEMTTRYRTVRPMITGTYMTLRMVMDMARGTDRTSLHKR